MKLRDLKPGMVVAYGNTNSIKAWGLGNNCRMAVIVDKGKYCYTGHWKKHIEKGGTKTQLLIAVQFGGTWRPALARAQDIIMMWDEYLEKAAEERRIRIEKSRERRKREDLYDARMAALRHSAKFVGVTVGPIYKTESVSMSLDDAEKLLKLASLYKSL